MKSPLVKILAVSIIAIGIVSTGVAVNAVNVGPRHGNLRAAQKLIEKAINKITDAQVAKGVSILDDAFASLKKKK